MPRLDRPPVLALALLAGAAWLLWAGERPAAGAADTAPPVPEQLGSWHGALLPTDARAVEILETDDVTLMEYRTGQEPPLWFARVAGFGKRAAYHPPELCYVGSHFEVLERGPVTVEANGTPRRVMRLVIGQDGQRSEAWYWFTAGDRVTPNYYQQQAWLVLGAMRGRTMSGTLVRISTPLDDATASHARLASFLAAYETATHGADDGA